MSRAVTASASAPSVVRRLSSSRARNALRSSSSSSSASASSRSAGRRRARGRTSTLRVEALRNFDYPEAILFDCDGVLCETERDGHRVTFNMTFEEEGLPHEWSVEKYHELLQVRLLPVRPTPFARRVACDSSRTSFPAPARSPSPSSARVAPCAPSLTDALDRYEPKQTDRRRKRTNDALLRTRERQCGAVQDEVSVPRRRAKRVHKIVAREKNGAVFGDRHRGQATAAAWGEETDSGWVVFFSDCSPHYPRLYSSCVERRFSRILFSPAVAPASVSTNELSTAIAVFDSDR